MPYFHNAGYDLYYRSAGKGKTALVLVHGWYQNGQQAFSALLPYLRGRYHVFIPDLPGHGLSPHMPEDFSTQAMEKLLVDFVRYTRKHYRCSRVFLLGHSYGAFTVLAIAARIPKELDGVIALSAVDDYSPYHKRLRNVLRIPRWLAPIYSRLQALAGAFPYGDREQLYRDAERELKPGRLAYVRKKNRTLSPAASRRYMRAFLSARVDWPPEKIATPLLLIYGGRDRLTPASWAKNIQPHFVRSTVKVIADAGHNVQISAPEVVAGYTRTFISQNVRAQHQR